MASQLVLEMTIVMFLYGASNKRTANRMSRSWFNLSEGDPLQNWGGGGTVGSADKQSSPSIGIERGLDKFSA